MTNAFVRKLERFGPLDPRECAALDALCADAHHHRADEDIGRGEPPATIPVMLSGFAHRFKLLSDGRRQIHGLFVPGDLCRHPYGHLSSPEPVVRTLSTALVAAVPAAALHGVMEDCPRIARAIWATTVIDDAILREWVVSLGRRTAYERMAHLFCEMVLRLRAVGLADGQSCELPLTQVDLGDLMGLSTVHVNRVLQQLRRDELIVLKGPCLTVRDFAALGRAADLDPAYLGLDGQGASRRSLPAQVDAA